MHLLENVVQPYAWGSAGAISQLLGRPPTGQPEAELWLGAHPVAPSKLPSGESLAAFIAKHPASLGEAVTARFGGQLPFLLKVLAAGAPLSLQAHPSLEQARAGFADENARGIPLTAPHRNYKDPNHKPELICALTRFHALCGFRALPRTVTFFRALGLETSRLENEGLRGWFGWLMQLEGAERAAVVAQAVRGAATKVPGFEAECALAQTLAQKYPGDVGIVGALALNLVVLEPGQALALQAGNLHAYLEGVGMELMANSDNVLRGGLTPKHVDVAQLLKVLDFSDGPVRVLEPRGEVAVYETVTPDFELTRVSVTFAHSLTRRGPEVLLVTEGTVTVNGVTLGRGQSCFIGADEGQVVTLDGHGVVFRATVGRF